MTGVASIVVIGLLFADFVFLVVMVVMELRNGDRFRDGFDYGLHCQLGKRAKQRYHRDVDCVFFVVPKDEYDREIDEIT